MHTLNSADRIERLVAEAYEFADEVVVGVDSNSHDETFERVQGIVDVAYRFELPGPGVMAAARLAAFDYATGDWILALDDDESMEPNFDRLRDELLGDPAVTHHYFARKYIVDLSPPVYLRAGPWYPDWQLRLFRNDRSLVWSPPGNPHTGYLVQGAGNFELRTSILHFEPLWCTPEQRRIKHEKYRLGGSTGEIEKSLEIREGLPREPVVLRKKPRPTRRPRRSQIYPAVRKLEAPPLPGWRAEIFGVKLKSPVAAGSLTVANVWVRNTGTQTWTTQREAGHWPYLNLAFRLLNEQKELLQIDGFRFPMPRQVAPKGKVLFAAPFTTPAEPGNYFLEWDLVSELECWFRDCGSPVLLTPLTVI